METDLTYGLLRTELGSIGSGGHGVASEPSSVSLLQPTTFRGTESASPQRQSSLESRPRQNINPVIVIVVGFLLVLLLRGVSKRLSQQQRVTLPWQHATDQYTDPLFQLF